jgi:hypothetical protein
MDQDSLTQILSGHHFSMAERVSRGLWPHAPLRFRDMANHLARVITDRDWFPRRFVPAAVGETVADSTAIERRRDGTFEVHIQRSGSSPDILAERGSRVFDRAEEAAAFFLEVHLPGDLDGWKVVPWPANLRLQRTALRRC